MKRICETRMFSVVF